MQRTEPLKPPTSQPQPIRVHHREASAQQGKTKIVNGFNPGVIS